MLPDNDLITYLWLQVLVKVLMGVLKDKHWLFQNRQLLQCLWSILTSIRVLHMPFAGRNNLIGCLNIFFHHKQKKQEKKSKKIKISVKMLLPKHWQTPKSCSTPRENIIFLNFPWKTFIFVRIKTLSEIKEN